jgi:hypothetical protein
VKTAVICGVFTNARPAVVESRMTIVNHGSTEMDEWQTEFVRQQESWRLLALSATEPELKEGFQAALDGALAGLTKLAKHWHGRGDYERLYNAFAACTNDVDAEMVEEMRKTALAIQVHLFAVGKGRED